MVTTTRATCDVPGLTGRRYYGEGEDEHLMVWRGPLSRPNMPLLVYCPPGHMFSMGERVMDPHTSSTPFLGTAVDNIYSTMGWPIVGLHYRPPHSADSPKREPFSSQAWPGPILSTMKAMQYLREHWDDETLWGDGGSIDRNRIGFIGSSSGHTMGLLLALIPPGRGGPSISTNALHQRPLGLADHRPNAVAGSIGQIDWTQYALDPADTDGPFTFDVHQYFFGKQSTLTFSDLPIAIKASASPWWWLPFLESRRTAFWGLWGTQPTSGAGSDLTPELWRPGEILDNKLQGRMFSDPHHYFQAKPWQDALQSKRCFSRTIWGSSTDNPTGFNSSNVGASTASKAADMLLFFQQLGWPAVV